LDPRDNKAQRFAIARAGLFIEHNSWGLTYGINIPLCCNLMIYHLSVMRYFLTIVSFIEEP